jgi:hypothetical protein
VLHFVCPYDIWLSSAAAILAKLRERAQSFDRSSAIYKESHPLARFHIVEGETGRHGQFFIWTFSIIASLVVLSERV